METSDPSSSSPLPPASREASTRGTLLSLGQPPTEGERGEGPEVTPMARARACRRVALVARPPGRAQS